MKGISGSSKLSVIMLILGLAAQAMRRTLYAVATDVKGLLIRNHPLGIALSVLTAAVLMLVVWAVRKEKISCRYEECYGSGGAGALGSLAAGAGILATVLTAEPAMGGYLQIAWYYLGLAAPVCLLIAGIVRVLGRKPFFLLHVVVCLFFLVHIVTRYQLWSANPQLQDYVFSMLGAMTLLFFGFYTAALEADWGNLRMSQGMGLATIFLCMTELARSSCPWLYLGGLLWVVTDLCSLRKTAETR